MIKYALHLLFVGYTFAILARLFLSWLPSFQSHSIAQFLRKITDPYLTIFQRVLPPIGGMLDLSPILGFYCLKFLENLVMKVL